MVSRMGQFDRQGHIVRKDMRQKYSCTAGGYYGISGSCLKTSSFPAGSIFVGQNTPVGSLGCNE